MRVLIFDYKDSEKKFFAQNNFSDLNFGFYETSLDSKTKLSDSELNNTDVISVTGASLLTEDVLSKFKNLRIVATRTFGFNHIDLNYCTKNKIAILNTGSYGEEAIAEYILGMIIMLTRQINLGLHDVKYNKLNEKKYEGKLLKEHTLGIIGCGKVGMKLAEFANFFGMKVLISSYKEKLSFDNICDIVPFEHLISHSDIIALHMPYTTENYRIIGEEEFSKMKEGTYIINTSCLELIDINALYKNLKSGKIKGASLDILDFGYKKVKAKKLENETLNSPQNSKITEKLIEMPNVIITPHIAFNTSDSIDYILNTTINNIRDYYKGMQTNRVC